MNKNNILALEGTLPIIGETGNRHHTKDKAMEENWVRGMEGEKGCATSHERPAGFSDDSRATRLPGESMFRAGEGRAKDLRMAAHEYGVEDWE